MKLRNNSNNNGCKGKRISELEEKTQLQGTEYLAYQEGEDNGKLSLNSLKDYLIELVQEYLINNGIIRDDYVQSEPAFKLLATLPELIADRACKDEFGNNINDTYLTRESVKEYIGSIFEDLFTENPPKILDGYITVDMLSDAVLQLLNSGGCVTNFPDDEDLTVKDGKLKFKDKAYDPNNYSGFGRKYLRRNMVDGVNVLTQEMISEPNVIYIIQYDYDLRGETITIPEGCTLDFQGGSFSNGTLSLSNNNTVNLNGGTLYTPIEITSTSNTIKENINIFNGIIKVPTGSIGIKCLQSTDNNSSAQLLSLNAVEIRGDIKDFTTQKSIESCKTIGVKISNSWVVQLNKCIINYTEIGIYLSGTVNNFVFNGGSLRGNNYHFIQEKGTNNVISNSDIEVCWQNVVMGLPGTSAYNSQLVIDKCYIESANSFYGIQLNTGTTVIKNSFIGDVLTQINDSSVKLIYVDNIFNPFTNDLSTRMAISASKDCSPTLIIRNNITNAKTSAFILISYQQDRIKWGTNTNGTYADVSNKCNLFIEQDGVSIIYGNIGQFDASITNNRRFAIIKSSVEESSCRIPSDIKGSDYNGMKFDGANNMDSILDGSYNLPVNTLLQMVTTRYYPSILYKNYDGDLSALSFMKVASYNAIPNNFTNIKGVFGITEAENGLVFINGAKGRIIPLASRGITTSRPSLTSKEEGELFYDTQLKKYIMWNGTAWVNMDGTALS